MKFTKTPLIGAYAIDLNKREDERGFFARSFCVKEFAEHGLETQFLQINSSLSVKKGTLRGLHYQLAPMEEVKVVRCIKGKIYDLILDLRRDSKTFGQTFGIELSEENKTMLYIPKGCAHGFMTLEDNSELFYLVSQFYSPELERGIRWDDPMFSIKWPQTPIVVSERDLCHPNFSLQEDLLAANCEKHLF